MEEDFDAKLKRLESLASEIKAPDITLEAAFKCFEEGMRLAKSMEKTLDETEGKVERLMNAEDLSEEERRPKAGRAAATPEIGLFDETAEVLGTRS